jgi:uncharacterized protein YcnI
MAISFNGMTGRIRRAILRLGASLTGLVAAVIGTALLSAAPASAHPLVSADDSTPGARAILTFSVPSELENGSPTTKLTVTLPDLTSVTTRATPGWTSQLDRDLQAGTVKTITWTAGPGVGIAHGEFEQFQLLVRLPKTTTVTFPTLQTYADGTVVQWDQRPLANGSEPAHPAPTLTLSGDQGTQDRPPAVSATPSSKTVGTAALWIAAAALGVTALAAALTYSAARRDN